MNLKLEIGKLQFGLKESAVKQLMGSPDKIIESDDFEDRIIWIYNNEKIRLSF
jgi:hypothetical protein